MMQNMVKMPARTTPNGPHPLTHVIHVNPKAARRIILAALRSKGMHLGDAAKQLGCGYGTLVRWVEQLGLEREIARLTAQSKREGWHHGRVGGHPPGERNTENGKPCVTCGEPMRVNARLRECVRCRDRASEVRRAKRATEKKRKLKLVKKRPKRMRAAA